MDIRGAVFLFENIMRGGVRGRKRVTGTHFYAWPVVAITCKFSLG
jgi:hypothetical protein